MIKDNMLRRLFILKARWNNYEHPAHPKPTKQRHIDLRSEFLLSGPVFSGKASELNNSLAWTIDKLARERGVLEACKFAISQVQDSISSGIRPYEYPNFKISYEHLMFQHIAARIRYLSSPEDNDSFRSPAVRNLFDGAGNYRRLQEAEAERKTPFKVNRMLRLDNDRIDYLKSVKQFLDDYLQTLDNYDYDESRTLLELYSIHKAIFAVQEPIEQELKHLSDAAVLPIHDKQCGDKPTPSA